MRMNEDVDPGMKGMEYRDCAKGAHMTPIAPAVENEKVSYRLAYLYCSGCGLESSATPGDYWNTPDSHPFECCEPMALCVRGSRFDGDTILWPGVTAGDLRRLVADIGEK